MEYGCSEIFSTGGGENQMAVIVGEQSFYFSIYSAGDNDYVETAEFNMPTGEVSAKVFLTSFLPYAGIEFPLQPGAGGVIDGMKRIRPDGGFETVGIRSTAAYDKKMAAVYYYFHVKFGVMEGMMVINYWG